MIIAIASTNPVKLNAVKQVFKPLYPQAKYISLAVDSQVKPQPVSIKETRQGAVNRARQALKKTSADLAVGLEGGVFKLGQEMFNFAWAVICHKNQTVSSAGGMCFPIPAKIAQAIDQGGELGPLIDQLTGKTNLAQKGGAVALFTDNLTNRTESYCQLIKMALAKFRRPDLYKVAGLTLSTH